MEKQRVMVIRTSDEVKDWIWSEIQEGRLHQGWGIPDTQLIEEDGKIVDSEIWKERYKQAALKEWKESVSDEKAMKRYWILYPMIELKKDDVVIVPKIPQEDSFVIAKVSSGYEFDFRSSKEREGENDFRHTILIDKNSLKIFNYFSCTQTRIIKKKMRAYQSAVNNVRNEDFIKAVNKLLKKESDSQIKNVNEIFSEIKLNAIEKIIEKIRKLPPKDLEDLVSSIFEAAGYEILEHNVYDGQGGDADIVATTKLPLISDYADIDLKLYIQVKQKEGRDWNDTEGIEQLQKIVISKEPTELNVKKILVSTTEEFSQQAKILAKKYNVILINGSRLVELMVKFL